MIIFNNYHIKIAYTIFFQRLNKKINKLKHIRLDYYHMNATSRDRTYS